METNVWGWICNDEAGDRPLHLKQRIPEVLVFKGCSLNGWYGTNRGGVAVKRHTPKDKEEQLKLLGRLGGPDVDQTDAPVAILRRCTTALREGDPSPIDTPSAELLSKATLCERVQQVRDGTVDKEEVWSVQAFVQPRDDVRILAVYSCDTGGAERSDIFGRRFTKAYRSGRTVRVPEPEDVAADGGFLALPESLRLAVEAKTLGAVRFASRFHGLDFEGLELEFVVDSEDNLVLHACWSSFLFRLEADRIRPVSLPQPDAFEPSIPVAPQPARVFPVPVIRETTEEMDFDRTLPKAPELLSPSQQPNKRRSSDSTASLAEPSNPWHTATGENFISEDCCVLLEVWCGGVFLGEALLPHHPPGWPAQEHTLALESAASPGDTSRPSRSDPRKSRSRRLNAANRQPLPERVSIARALVSLSWHGQAAHQTLAARVVEANGLTIPPDGEGLGVRALLWLRRSGQTDWEPLWASQDAKGGQDSEPWIWDEETDLGLHPAPANMTATLSSPRGEGSSRRSIATSVAKSSEVVAGARLVGHWGMNEQDGCMRTGNLASQVLQRNTSKRSRGSMLVRIAGQLERCHKAKAALDEYLQEVQDAGVKMQREAPERQKEIEKLEGELCEGEARHKARLAKVCKEMHVTLDDRREDGHNEAHKVWQVQQRIRQKRAAIEQLEREKANMQDALDKTVEQFDEVSSSYARIQNEMLRTQKARLQGCQREVAGNKEVQAAIDEAEAQLEASRSELLETKRACLHAPRELNAKREFARQLEEFIRRIASGGAVARTGGGFDMDNAAVLEATFYVQELEREEAERDLRNARAQAGQPVPAS